MKIFYCQHEGTVSIVSAFNRGHAVKLLSKEFKEKNLGSIDKAVVTEFEPELNGSKGHIKIIEYDQS